MSDTKYTPAFERVLAGTEEFRYMMLDRMKTDCKYYLANGLRNSNVLWAGNVKDHISNMKALWGSFPEDKKPEWLSLTDIEAFEESMSKTLLFSEVTLSTGDYEESFFVGGIPRDQDDLTDSSGYDDFMCDIEEGSAISVHVEAYTYGEGETRTASHEELCEFVDVLRCYPDLLRNCCDNIEDLDFSFNAD